MTNETQKLSGLKETLRTCNRCRQTKSIRLFYVAKHCSGGYRPDCIECAKVALRKQWKKHNARNRRYRKRYQKENREQILQYLRDYKKKNRDVQRRYDDSRQEDATCRVYGRCHCGNEAIARAGRKPPKEFRSWRIAGVKSWFKGKMVRVSGGICHRCRKLESQVYEIEARREKWKGAPEGRLLARMHAEARDFSANEVAQLMCITERHAIRLLGNLAKAGDVVSTDGTGWGDTGGFGNSGTGVKRYRTDTKARIEDKNDGIDELMRSARRVRLGRLPRAKCSHCLTVILNQDREKQRHAETHSTQDWYNRTSPVFYRCSDAPVIPERPTW